MGSEQITDETIAEIERELDGDGVWIDPAFARSQGISAEDEDEIEAAVAATDRADLNVVLVEVSTDDDRFQGSFGSLSAWIHDSRGGDATYVGWERYASPHVTVDAYGAQPATIHVDDVAAHEVPDDLAGQVVRIAELLEDGTAESRWDEIPDDEKYSWTTDEGVQVVEVVGAIGIGIGIAAVVAVVVLGVRGWRRRRSTRTAFALPATVLHTVRVAEDKRLRQQADAEVLALGEAIGSGEPGGTAHSLDAWQQALDHYAAARSILSQAAAPADVVGALVLARRGDDARSRAQQRKPSAWAPRPGCWFNPLHEGPTSEVTWRDDDRRVDVPACAACAADVRAGREPRDILDLIEGDRTVHYFRLDLGAWSRTGYGSLDRDLLGALRTRGSRGSRGSAG
jgi:hypothetical protein